MTTELHTVLRARGAVFFSLFGAVWLLAWAWFTHRLPAVAAIVPAAAVLLWIAVRRGRSHGGSEALAAYEKTPARRRGKRVFMWTNIAQWLGVFLGVNVLNNTGHGEWALALIVAIVGLHMFPLAWAFGNRAHYVTGAALLLLAVACPLSAAGGPGDAVIALWTGLTLWLSAARALRPRHRQPAVPQA